MNILIFYNRKMNIKTKTKETVSNGNGGCVNVGVLSIDRCILSL